ncbi:hypothetical protein BH09SUM1_BH09SUM1_31720 [soil metagenome]
MGIGDRRRIGFVKYFDHILTLIPQGGFAVLAVIAASCIIWMGLRSKEQVSGMAMMPPGADKVLHAFAYASMTACAFRAVYPWSVRRRPLIPHAWILALVYTACVGGLDEFLQGWVHRGRSSEIQDWMADLTGAAVVCALGVYCRARNKSNRGLRG